MDWRLVANTGGTTGSVNTVGQTPFTINTAGSDTMTVIYRLLGTNTVGDMAGPGLRAFQPDGVTLQNQVISPSQGFAPTVDGANVSALATFDLRGIQKVQARFTNNNAGTLNYEIWYYVL